MLQHKLNRALRDPRILDIKVVVESKQPASRQGLVAKPEIGESFLPGVAAVDVAEREALTEIAGSEVARGARQDTDEAGVLVECAHVPLERLTISRSRSRDVESLEILKKVHRVEQSSRSPQRCHRDRRKAVMHADFKHMPQILCRARIWL